MLVYDPVADAIVWQFLYDAGAQEFTRTAVAADSPAETADGEYRSLRGSVPVIAGRELMLDAGAHRIWRRDAATGIQLPVAISTTDQGLLDWSFSGIRTDGVDVYLFQWGTSTAWP